MIPVHSTVSKNTFLIFSFFSDVKSSMPSNFLFNLEFYRLNINLRGIYIVFILFSLLNSQ